ncbi:MAG: HAD-IC family P-type ATPase, partial [Candidatus Aenigmarchaeota archaeon]|nr:HAD-IC family P-type ATPase [Candidatus Aenigmarchaeota archaeon]
REEEIPFSSEKKIMSVLCAEKEGRYIYSKGAPEVLIDKCKFIKNGNKIITLDKKEKEKLMEVNKKLALKKFRVLALAYNKSNSLKGNEKDFIFLGLVALDDPPRTEVKSAIASCKEAGIKVKMITGDNKETAAEIGKEIGISGNIFTGMELDKLTDDELTKMVDKISIFARVKPEHKIRIVKALKNNKEIVTMTGDGVNDAPALKEAHIGVAMGMNGTDVSRESADLVLKDDNFATIVSAVKEGRTIFRNIQKVVTYMLSCNYSELFVIFFGILFGMPLPLLALQILFLNIVTDDMPAITLGFNSPSKGIMKSKPRKKTNILDKQQLIFLAIAGITMGIGSLFVYHFTLNILNQEIAVARTTVLITLIFFEIANAFNFRSFKNLVCATPLFANKYLVYASAGSVLAALLIIYTPLNVIFETAPLGWFNLGIAFLTSLSVIVVFDVLKLINRKRKIF